MYKLQRREFIKSVIRGVGFPFAIVAVGGLHIDASRAQSVPKPESPEMSMEQWMATWMNEQMNKFQKDVSGALELGRFLEPIYFLLKSISWRPPQTGRYSQLSPVSVPKGFVTDMASIPRLFWSAVRPDGKYAYAAIIHDYLYWQQDRPRGEADKIFRSAMEDLRVTDAVAEPIFRMVDLLGGVAWDKNARLKASGEKRILAKYPDDPRTSWEEWKKRADVFRR